MANTEVLDLLTRERLSQSLLATAEVDRLEDVLLTGASLTAAEVYKLIATTRVLRDEYERGYDVGYSKGWDAGHDVGHDDGYEIGFENGLVQGRDEGRALAQRGE